MSALCPQCFANTVWDDNVASAVCTSCGSLADPSQSLLTSSLYVHQNDTLEPSLWDPSASTTLKSLRSRNNWDLAGQGKESRDRKNMYAIAEFIKSLAVSLNASGLSPRATTLFNQVKSASSFRWGQKSRTVAAACLAIALREFNRPDSYRDIASLADVPPSSVSREFMSIISTLSLTLPYVDPSVHIATLQAHITSAIQDQDQIPSLPSNLVKSLRTVCLRSASNAAISLGEVLARLSPDHDILRLPAPPTACGIFILALEAEIRSVLNPLGDLAHYLGSRCHISQSVVMSRYKSIQDIIASWIERIPWLDKYENKHGRAKISKRLVVARGLKDVLRFHQDIFHQKAKPTLELDLAEDDHTQSNEVLPESKRPKLNNAISNATKFLLNPTAISLSACQRKSTATFTSHLSLAAYILTTKTTASSFRAPTRLQLLAHDRGGVDESQIPDEDLFAEGELEKLLRSNAEVVTLRETLGWKEDEDWCKSDHSTLPQNEQTGRKKRKKSQLEDGILQGTALSPRKKSRLDMEALALFMSSHEHGDVDPDFNLLDASLFETEEMLENLEGDPKTIFDSFNSGPDGYMTDADEDNIYDLNESPQTTPHRRHFSAHKAAGLQPYQEETIIRTTWRPTTPDHIISNSRYEEEYD